METTPYSINSPDDFDLLIESYGADEAIPTLVRPSLGQTQRSHRYRQKSTFNPRHPRLRLHHRDLLPCPRNWRWRTRDARSYRALDSNGVRRRDRYKHRAPRGRLRASRGVERITIPTFIGDMRKNYALRCKALRKTLLDRSV